MAKYNLPLMAAIDPQLVDNAAVSSDWVNFEDFEGVLFVMNLGATDITQNGKLQQATDGSGSGVKDITGKAITELTALEDNSQCKLEVRASEMDVANSFTHVRLTITVDDGTLGGNVSAVAIGIDPRYSDVTEVASLAETV